MAPRCEYVVPQTFQFIRYIPDDKVTFENAISIEEEDVLDAISLFKQTLTSDGLLELEDEIQSEDTITPPNAIGRCTCHTTKAKKSLLPEFELETLRLGPSGPWFTVPRSQHKISRQQRRKLNDLVRQKLFKE